MSNKPFPFHQHNDAATAKAWKRADLSAADRGALMSIIHETNTEGAPWPADWWIANPKVAGLKSAKVMRQTLDRLERAQMIRVHNGLVLPLQFLNFSGSIYGPSSNGFKTESKTSPANPNEHGAERPMESQLSGLKSALHGSEVSYRSPTHAHERTPAREAPPPTPAAQPPRQSSPPPGQPPAGFRAQRPGEVQRDGWPGPVPDDEDEAERASALPEATHEAPEFVMSPDEVPY
jgi:hypothetical protein